MTLTTLLEDHADLAPVFLLATLSLACLLWIILFSQRSVRRQLRRRAQRLTASQQPQSQDTETAANPDPTSSEAFTGRQAAINIRDAQRKRQGAHFSLRLFMRQGGMSFAGMRYVLIDLALGLVLAGILLAMGVSLLSAVILAVIGAVGLPLGYLAYQRAKRLRAFESEFPAAVDTVARGLRSGLPLPECLRIVADEGEPPVSTEFQHMVDDQGIGLSISQSMERLGQRVPLKDVRFFTIVVSMQSGTGGGLAEALESLSETLRSRRMLADKVKIMSQEAKSSAAIIGSLPILVAGVLYILNPDYVGLLFNTSTGNWVLAGCVVWMLAGVQVMRSMINFDA